VVMRWQQVGNAGRAGGIALDLEVARGLHELIRGPGGASTHLAS
jgi:hypothetical protein